jgi:hypothetical protein
VLKGIGEARYLTVANLTLWGWMIAAGLIVNPTIKHEVTSGVKRETSE